MQSIPFEFERIVRMKFGWNLCELRSKNVSGISLSEEIPEWDESLLDACVDFDFIDELL